MSDGMFDASHPQEATDAADDTVLAGARKTLSAVFGYKNFRPHQEAIVETLICGRDALVLMPTGGGKSLCYQIPALVRRGTGIVVSPLIALMQDQVDALAAVGVSAAFLNSSQDWQTQQEIADKLRAGALDLLYVAPERLVRDQTVALLSECKLSLFAIDEAHCVAQWGHDFRPEYRQLRFLAERFPDVPRVALTATADVKTREEIVNELALGEAEQFVAGFDRPNIRYMIAESGRVSAREQLWRFIQSEHAKDAGIVYCLSRKAVEETAAWLSNKGRTALPYHAGLDRDLRAKTQARFLNEDGLIIVATIAFGMGIDKPDVRFVAHLSLPKSIEAYYQETGRAGRDGEPANAWMVYGLQDIVQQRQWIEASDGSEAFSRVQREKLDALIALCETASCRRQLLLRYFDDDLPEPCGNCDNCLNPPKTIDGTVIAQKALSAIYRTDERFGVTYVVNVLLGKADDRIAQNRHDRLSVFGVGDELDAAGWKSVFRQLMAAGFVEQDREGHQTLQLSGDARLLLKGQLSFTVREPRATEAASAKRSRGSKGPSVDIPKSDRSLFEALKQTRKQIAQEANVPPYVVCHDRTLAELAAVKPGSLGELEAINGLGKTKIKRFGETLLNVIKGFAERPELQNQLSATVNETLRLHLDGHAPDVIAAARGIAETTVFGHLAEAIEAGATTPDAVLDLEPTDADQIEAAFDQCGTRESGQLKAAFEALDGRYDYGVLRCLLAAT